MALLAAVLSHRTTIRGKIHTTEQTLLRESMEARGASELSVVRHWRRRPGGGGNRHTHSRTSPPPVVDPDLFSRILDSTTRPRLVVHYF